MFDFPDFTEEAEEEKVFFQTVSSNVKSVRKLKKMSQLEVALCIGLKSPGFYASMENYAHGKHFNLLHLFRLSKLFNISIEEFFKKNPLNDDD
jgi:transcriptional regulator with XRE-family HTH domain